MMKGTIVLHCFTASHNFSGVGRYKELSPDSQVIHRDHWHRVKGGHGPHFFSPEKAWLGMCRSVRAASNAVQCSGWGPQAGRACTHTPSTTEFSLFKENLVHAAHKWPWLHYCEDSDSVFCFTCIQLSFTGH